MAHPWMFNKQIKGYARLPEGVGWEDKGWAPLGEGKEPTPEQLEEINHVKGGTAAASASGTSSK